MQFNDDPGLPKMKRRNIFHLECIGEKKLAVGKILSRQKPRDGKCRVFKLLAEL